MVVEAKLATAYKVIHALEPIHSGGPVLAGSYAGEQDAIVTRCGGSVVVRSRSTGEARKTFALVEDGGAVVAAVALSPTHLFTVLSNNLLESRDLATGEAARSWKAHTSPVLCMAHHAASALLATGSADHSVRVWNSAQGFCTHNLKGVHGGVVNVVRFHADPARMELFSGAEDGSIARWSLADGKSRTYRSHVSAVRSLDVSPDGRLLVSGGRDQVVTVWDLATGKAVRTIPAMESVEALLFVDDDTFVSGGEKGMLRKWSVKKGTCVQEGAKLTAGEHGIAYIAEHDGCLVVTTSDLHIVSVDAADLSPSVSIPGSLGEVTDVAFLDDGALVVATNDVDLKVFPSPASLACLSLQGHTQAILSVATHGDWVVTGSRDHSVRLWRRAGGAFACVSALAGHTDSVGAVCIAVAPGAALPVLASASADMTAKLWEVSGSAEGGFAVACRWTVKAHDKDINSLAFTPTLKQLVSGSQDRTAKVWRVDDGAPLGTLTGHKRGVWAVRCSPAERVIATASGDQTIKLWSATTFECLRTFEGHANSVLRLAFIRDGAELVSTGSDGLVKIWDVRSNECTRTLDEHQDRIWTLAMQGARMATGDASGAIKVWEDCTQEEVLEARQQRESRLLMEQDLANMLVRKDFKNAILVSLELEQPFRLFGLLNEYTLGCALPEAQERLARLFESLPAEKLDRVLLYIRDWNTSFKRAALAQVVLNVLLRMRERLALPALQQCCRALLPYSERHFEHIQELASSAYLVDFVLHHMDSYVVE